MAFDSTPAALEVQRETWRRLGPAGRLRIAIEMSEEVRAVALAGVRARHATWEPARAQAELTRFLYGVDVGAIMPRS